MFEREFIMSAKEHRGDAGVCTFVSEKQHDAIVHVCPPLCV